MERKGSPGGRETKGIYSGEGASGLEISGLPFRLVECGHVSSLGA
jgi:hypothetical protein